MDIDDLEGLDDLSDGLKIEKIPEDDGNLFQDQNPKNDQEIIKHEVHEELPQEGVDE